MYIPQACKEGANGEKKELAYRGRSPQRRMVHQYKYICHKDRKEILFGYCKVSSAYHRQKRVPIRGINEPTIRHSTINAIEPCCPCVFACNAARSRYRVLGSVESVLAR